MRPAPMLTMLLLLPLAGCGTARAPTTNTTVATTATTASVTAASTTPTTTPPSCRYRTFRDGAIAPDPACTPGAVDARAAAHPQQTICVPGYARRARPSQRYTQRIKLALLDRYQATEPSASYVLDHLVTIQDGGSPTDPRNMWPQPIAQAQQKNAIDDYLHREICAGKITVQQAAHELEGDWLGAVVHSH